MSQVPIYLLLSLPLVGAFAMFSLGIVVIHQASKVLNLAHGAMAMVPAFVAYSLVQAHIPMPVAIAAGIAAGALIGIAVERVFVRSLRRQGPTAQTVGTIAALGLLLGFAVKVWGTTPRTAVRLFPDGGIHVGASILRWGQLGLLGVAVLCTVALFAVFRFTETGLAMRSAADNRRAASLMGIDPDATARMAWAVGGALAAVSGILLAAVTVLHPINLTLIVLPAFVATLIGGLSSLPGAAGGAAVVGVVFGMVPAIALIPGVGGFATQVGAPQLVLTVVALVVMALRGQRFVGAGAQADFSAAVAVRAKPAEERTRAPAPTWLKPVGIAAVVAFALGWPFLAPFSIVGDAIQACIILLVAASLVLLTGWVGQISLAQATLVGIGAFSTAVVANRFGLHFPLNLPVAAGISAAVAVGIGLVALRVRGLYLAVATLIVLWMSNEYLFRTSWLVGAGGSASLDVPSIGRRDAFPFFDFTERRTFYFVALAAVAAALWALANLRDSKTGRAFFAVRGSEMAAASLGIDITRYKLLAFGVSGLLAGVAGNLLITGQGSAAPSQFDFNTSLFYLAVAVVGGIVSLGGAVAASIVFALLSELFFRVSALSGWLDVVSASLLAGVLLLYPGGLAAITGRFAPHRKRILRRPMPTTSDNGDGKTAPALPALREATRRETPALLDVAGVTVKFGGLLAVDDVSLQVREGEIVGLIGPNGAGKTTLFNAVSGLVVPTGGRVNLFGRDVSDEAVHKRAALGLGRTFQVVQLFSQLSIFENLMVATHLQNPTGVLSHIAVTAGAVRHERAARSRVFESLAFLGLEEIADRPVAGQPLGVLRMVEIARALVTGARLVMLDEAASGLDTAETERLVERLFHVRDELGVSLLLIEHDVRMVTSTCDYIYVINQGKPLAEGTPDRVQRDEEVIAAYLGVPEADALPVA